MSIEEFEKYREGFLKYIESIGFTKTSFGDNGFSNYIKHEYLDYIIFVYPGYYNFDDGTLICDGIYFNNLKPLQPYFKKELRSIKLKELLR